MAPPRSCALMVLAVCLAARAQAKEPDEPKPLSKNPKDYTKAQYGDMTDETFESSYNKLVHKYGQQTRKEAIEMSMDPDWKTWRSKKKVEKAKKSAVKEWIEMMDMDRNNELSEEEFWGLMLMENYDKEDVILMERMRAFYLSKPKNMKKWTAKVAQEYEPVGFPGVDGDGPQKDVSEWFKHSGFFTRYRAMHDYNKDGKVTVQELAKELPHEWNEEL